MPELEPGTEYQAYISARNSGSSGWSTQGPRTTFRTKSEVEITGTQTQEDRDVELRKRAVDVDADSPPPIKRKK